MAQPFSDRFTPFDPCLIDDDEFTDCPLGNPQRRRVLRSLPFDEHDFGATPPEPWHPKSHPPIPRPNYSQALS
jgi:hypothetical protein